MALVPERVMELATPFEREASMGLVLAPAQERVS
jgi:hypothetical protein